jgi:hypothetical protein
LIRTMSVKQSPHAVALSATKLETINAAFMTCCVLLSTRDPAPIDDWMTQPPGRRSFQPTRIGRYVSCAATQSDERIGRPTCPEALVATSARR